MFEFLMFEFLGYTLFLILLGFGLFKLVGIVEEASFREEGEKSVALTVVYGVGLVLIFLSGFHLGGRGERKAEERFAIVKVEKENWSKDVKGKFEAYNVALTKKNKDLSAATNELVKVTVRLNKLEGYMESNMVPRYVVAPIVGEVGKFYTSSIFPNYDFTPVEIPIEPNSGNASNRSSTNKVEIVGRDG